MTPNRTGRIIWAVAISLMTLLVVLLLLETLVEQVRGLL